MHHVLGLILGGGRGTRLYPLTKLRAKPAVPLPGTRTDDCHLGRVMLADGCLLQDAVITDSVIGLRSIVGPGVRISATNRQKGIPDVGIGPGSSIEGAIIDKNARIGHNVVIRPHPEVTEMIEQESYVIRDGIVIVPKNAVIPNGTLV